MLGDDASMVFVELLKQILEILRAMLQGILAV